MQSIMSVESEIKALVSNRQWAQQNVDRFAARGERAEAWIASVEESDAQLAQKRHELLREAEHQAKWAAREPREYEAEKRLENADTLIELIDLIDATLRGEVVEVKHKSYGYKAELISWMLQKRIAKSPRHATAILNLSKGVELGWNERKLAEWSLLYRWYRDHGRSKSEAVQAAHNKVA